MLGVCARVPGFMCARVWVYLRAGGVCAHVRLGLCARMSGFMCVPGGVRACLGLFALLGVCARPGVYARAGICVSGCKPARLRLRVPRCLCAHLSPCMRLGVCARACVRAVGGGGGRHSRKLDCPCSNC